VRSRRTKKTGEDHSPGETPHATIRREQQVRFLKKKDLNQGYILSALEKNISTPVWRRVTIGSLYGGSYKLGQGVSAVQRAPSKKKDQTLTRILLNCWTPNKVLEHMFRKLATVHVEKGNRTAGETATGG